MYIDDFFRKDAVLRYPCLPYTFVVINVLRMCIYL